MAKEKVIRKSVRELQTNKEKMDRIRAEIVRLVDAAEIICHEIRQGESRCLLGDDCPFHAALKKNRQYGCEVSGCIQVLGMPIKKGSPYPMIEEDIRIPIDSQTNYK